MRVTTTNTGRVVEMPEMEDSDMVIQRCPDYYQEKLPFEKWSYHYEVVANYGDKQSPFYQGIHYSGTEQEAKEWVECEYPGGKWMAQEGQLIYRLTFVEVA